MGWKENIKGLNSKQVDEIWQENKKINFYQSLKVWEKQLMTWLELMIYDWGSRWWFVWLDKSGVQQCWGTRKQRRQSECCMQCDFACTENWPYLVQQGALLSWVDENFGIAESIRAGGCYWSRSRRPRLAWRGANLLLQPFSKRSNKKRQLKQYVDNM